MRGANPLHLAMSVAPNTPSWLDNENFSDKLPKILLRTESMFFLEREKPTLKDIFDNTRNYLICATVFAVGVWFRRGAKGFLPPVTEDPASYYLGQLVGTAFIVVATILTLLNMVQTFFMLVPAYIETTGGLKDWADSASPRWKRVAKVVRDVVEVVEEGVGLIIVVGVFMLILYLVVTLYRNARIG
jgi:hypothetical protein